MKTKVIYLLLFFCLVISGPVLSSENTTYSTWDDFEVDRLASIWLLKRFIAPDAEIKIYPKGEMIKEGIEFDTPYAELGRRFNKSAFEVLIDHYNIRDDNLILMSKIIHDIEINVWQRKIFEESVRIDQELWHIIESGTSNDDIINNAYDYFDKLYEEMNR